MTRLIDADALMPMMKYATTDSEIGVFPIKIGFNAIAKVIENAPTVDAEPVVRCKDCKYYNPQQHYCEGIGNWFGYDGEWSDNGYCYKAERKKE